MRAIFQKEFKSYFTSMIGWIVLLLFFGVSGILFWLVLASNIVDTNAYLSIMLICSLIAAPLLTMRLLSEEKRQKTDQLLLTAPVSLTGIVVGKFLAATAVYAICLSMALVYTFVLSLYAQVAWGVLLYALFGLLIAGMGLIALGLFMSSITESQIIALISSLGLMIVLFLLLPLGASIDIGWLQKIVESLSFINRYTSFLSGLINLSDILFYLSFTVVFLFAAVRVLEKKRWS